MKLSQHNALQIVSNINEIIQQKMNIMNSNGIIIASSDELRIGSFHAGAKKIIDEHLDELIVNEDGGYEGTRAGINYPLVVDGEVIGVVGVTGSDEQTFSYAKIVKRMTELLVQELALREAQETEDSMRNRFLDEWLNGDSKNINKQFVERGLSIGIDIRVPRRFLAMSVYDASGSASKEHFRRLEQAEHYLQQLSSYGTYHFSLLAPSLLITGLPAQDDAQLLKTAEDYRQLIENRYQVNVAIGIDSAQNAKDYLLAYRACLQAKKALHACMRTHRQDIRFYDDLNMEIFTDELSETVKREYIHKIFCNMSDEEILKASQVLETYYDTGGSVAQSAARLYIHKNTMQNRLKQIEARTGRDPRSIRTSSLFYNALYFYRELGRDI